MRGETILIIDDEKLIRWTLQQELQKAGYATLEADSLMSGLELFERHDPDMVILDQLLPDGNGIDLLLKLEAAGAAAPVVMLTALDRSDVAVRAMKHGAVDYVTKPVNIEELKIVIAKALESTRLKRQIDHFCKEKEREGGFGGMIGVSPTMETVFTHITKIAQSSNTTVLVTGESGTGKELAARAVHFLSSRREKPLMTVNVTALSETIIESELFGHEKGAFTDARFQKKGIFELADGGSVFLDEIGDMPLKIQAKLLRVLEQKTFQRVGGTTDITVDVRIITATNQHLEQLVAEHKFRTDLYYRLNVAAIVLPPLRHRGDDVFLLADYFIHDFNAKFHKRFRGLADETKTLFRSYHWPGNVRELRNALERAILLWDDEYVRLNHIELLHDRRKNQKEPADFMTTGPGGSSLFDMEKNALRQALARAENNQSQAARLLQISRDTLRYRMKKYGIMGK